MGFKDRGCVREEHHGQKGLDTPARLYARRVYGSELDARRKAG